MKTYSDTYLYKKYPEYNKQLIEFVMGAERIDKNSKEFENVLFDIKRRQISNCLTKILLSNNVVLCIGARPLSKAFKVVVCDDIKTDKKPRVFIDVTDCIQLKNGEYVCNKIDWIISYLITALVAFVYKMQENKLTSNQSVLKDGAEAFTKSYSYIIDRLYKISTVQSLRKRVEYIAALYYQINIIGKDYEKQFDSVKAVAMKIADIEPKDAKIVDLQIDSNTFLSIETFVNKMNDMFGLDGFSVDILVAKWMQCFGTGTIFALEFLPAFSSMLTNTYVGGYIDQQLTIEKVTGQSMVKFTKTILQIGAGVV